MDNGKYYILLVTFMICTKHPAFTVACGLDTSFYSDGYMKLTNKIDFSFIPSYKCNLKCWFCMYECSPDNTETLDYELTKNFSRTIDWSRISSFGFYGGEISVDLPLYQKFIDLVPKYIPKFTITNGSWSRDKIQSDEFLDFIYKNKLKTKVSCTPEHKKFQDTKLLKEIEIITNRDIFVKTNDDTKGKLLSMGRLKDRKVECTMKCKSLSLPINGNELVYRMALEPNGNIILQSCDGRYPIIGNYYNTLTEIISKFSKFGCKYENNSI